MHGIHRQSTLAAALAALTVALASPAAASDYSHDCASSDGAWKMWDESLSAAGDDKATDIPYTTLKDTVLSHKQGYCVSRGKKFEFEAKTYIRRVRFTYQGQRYDVDLLCEMSADGLPAAYKCEKEVVTRDVSTSGVKTPKTKDEGEPEVDEMPSDGALWNHNGSLMRLIAAGADRTFVYENPRPGMRKAGAKKGDVVFQGTRDGTTYSGTAYIFSKGCGSQGYAVTGHVTDDDRGVVLEGDKPVLDSSCNVTGTRRDVLRFDYVRR